MESHMIYNYLAKLNDIDKKLLEKMMQNGVLIKVGSGPTTKYKMLEGK